MPFEEALTGDRKIFLATQHDAGIDEPRPEDIFSVGTIGNIVQSVKMPDGNIKVLVEGLERAKAVEMNDADGFFVATVRVANRQLEVNPQIEAVMQRVTSLFEQYGQAATVAQLRNNDCRRAHGRAGEAF